MSWYWYHFHCLFHSPRAQRYFAFSDISGTSTRSYSTTAEPTKCTKHGAIQKGSAQCTVGRVSISCLLYAMLYSGNYSHFCTTYSSHLAVILQMATILVSFNSTLNPFLYCRWRLLKWDKQWSRQSDKHFAVHGVRPFSSYSWSYKYLQCKADR